MCRNTVGAADSFNSKVLELSARPTGSIQKFWSFLRGRQVQNNCSEAFCAAESFATIIFTPSAAQKGYFFL
jgi:hypothetical protein